MLADTFISANFGHIKQVDNKDRVNKVEHPARLTRGRLRDYSVIHSNSCFYTLSANLLTQDLLTQLGEEC